MVIESMIVLLCVKRYYDLMLEFSDMILQTGELVSENVVEQARQVCPVWKTSYIQ